MEFKNKAFAQFTFSIIKPFAISFTFLYLFFAVAQYFILSSDYKNLMVIMALSTSFYFGVVILLIYKKINLFENNKQTLRFSIIDTGIGIDFKNQQKIFEAFTQEDSTTTRKFGGTGLGLPISNKILNLMNSNLHLESIYGKGSNFYFDVTFDVIKIIPTEVKDESLLNSNSLFIKKTLILIVDDNSINIFLTKILTKNIIPDAEIIEAKNGFIALDLFRGNNFNLIIMDILMPAINGYDTAKKIRLQETNNRVPIIGLTAGVMKQEREKCLEAGMNDYLSNPIDKEVLEKILFKFLTK
jgi:CheY-like chemotaxis protein